ncbi:RidA family protein (plasmid) [Natrialbaceae archaeon A-arb3/5]
MKKKIINPETGEWAEHEVAYSDGVAIETPTHTRIFISGVISDEDGIEAQTRDVLTQIEETVTEYGGDMTDIVRVRVYITRPNMDEETLEVVHATRREFFVKDHYPASTLVEVEDLVDDQSMIEIDADAVIPNEEWNVETL